jgi:hypothetical protein
LLLLEYGTLVEYGLGGSFEFSNLIGRDTIDPRNTVCLRAVAHIVCEREPEKVVFDAELDLASICVPRGGERAFALLFVPGTDKRFSPVFDESS